jgi:hypothetical protein
MKIRWNHFEKYRNKRKRDFEELMKEYQEVFKENQQAITKQRVRKGLKH